MTTIIKNFVYNVFTDLKKKKKLRKDQFHLCQTLPTKLNQNVVKRFYHIYLCFNIEKE